MTKQYIETMLDEVGIPYEYHHFETTNAVDPPFLIWIISETNNFKADGKVFHRVNQVNLELYTDEKSFELEEKLEAILYEHEITWEKTEDYIQEEKMYMVTYEMEV